MGKKRGGKKGGKPAKNFKVVGSKSLVKTKAKPVKSDLKKLNKDVQKQKLKEIDEQLVTIQEKLVKKPEPKKVGRKGKNKRGKLAKGKGAQEATEKIDKLQV